MPFAILLKNAAQIAGSLRLLFWPFVGCGRRGKCPCTRVSPHISSLWDAPFITGKLTGNIPDVKTLRVLIYNLDVLGHPKVKLVIDWGFYSEDNVGLTPYN